MKSNAHNIAISVLSVCNNIAKRKLANRLLYATWEKVIFPFFIRQVNNSTEQEITADLNLVYKELKPFFEKKKTKEDIEEANKLSGIKLPSIFLQEERKYF